uniref:sulfatase/phosphatase domain-containing protein n=1 Tax=Mariniflexile sp. TaxID=1979402 RepID=UPI0040481AD7
DIDDMALNIDVPSTILDLAGVTSPSSWHGKSLMPYVNDEKPNTEHDTILIEHLWDFKSIPPSEGVRTKDWKYFRYVDDKSIQELYNLKEDPQETNNLINDESYQGIVENLRNKLEELIKKYKDPYAFNPTHTAFKHNQFSWDVSNKTQNQTAYQILVSSSKENIDNNNGDVWNSGKVESSASKGINYEGQKLIPNKQYYWKVRVYDDINRTGRYTESESFQLK